MDIETQIASGKLICVFTGRTLQRQGGQLVTADNHHAYPLLGGNIPQILRDPPAMHQYTNSNEAMVAEYAPASLQSFRQKIRHILFNDYRTRASQNAFESLFAGLDQNALILSVGGGPSRPHPWLTNLNIEAFENVEIVADAHVLPYADNSVDAIYCEAVLEHLSDPGKAVEEMQRVLKPGGNVLATTPFLQAYHGYPHHYQNFTLAGHELLFTKRGFIVLQSGSAVGPVNAIVTLMARACELYIPGIFGKACKRLCQAITFPFRGLDRLIENHAERHMLSSTTFVLAQKQ
ncbi:MAG: class I SAM-dependent methyltransferase [Rickettsiales bacterium]